MIKSLLLSLLIGFSVTVSAEDVVNVQPQIIYDATVGFQRCYFDRQYYRHVLNHVCNISYWSNSNVEMGYDLEFGKVENRDGNFANLNPQQREYKQIECFRKMCNI